SANEGQSWTQLPAVPGTETGTATFTWVAAGAPGHVGVIYFWSPSNGDPGSLTNATWDAKWAETFDANSATPHWTLTTLETGVHTGAICIAASCSGANRFAGDFISSTFDASGASHLTWMRDSGGTSPEVRYARVVGATTAVGPPEMPAGVWLASPAPNPTTAGAGFRFSLPREADVSLVL